MNSVPQRSDDFLSRVMEDGAVVVSPLDGQLNVFNEVGSFIWESIDGQRSAKALVDMVTVDFRVSADQASADVLAFLETLEQRGMIVWVPSS